ncbi:MAG: redoxin domain-containing protein [Planctomycetes bacterium]|nr:redoxin domain-containing protein [Planctomycetota bacterium]
MVELDQLQKYYSEIVSRGVEVCAISVDPPEVNSALRKRLDLPCRFLSDPAGVLADRLGVMTPGYNLARDGGGVLYPAHFLVDLDGRVRWVYRPESWRTRARPQGVLRAIDESFQRSVASSR